MSNFKLERNTFTATSPYTYEQCLTRLQNLHEGATRATRFYTRTVVHVRLTDQRRANCTLQKLAISLIGEIPAVQADILLESLDVKRTTVTGTLKTNPTYALVNGAPFVLFALITLGAGNISIAVGMMLVVATLLTYAIRSHRKRVISLIEYALL